MATLFNTCTYLVLAQAFGRAAVTSGALTPGLTCILLLVTVALAALPFVGGPGGGLEPAGGAAVPRAGGSHAQGEPASGLGGRLSRASAAPDDSSRETPSGDGVPTPAPAAAPSPSPTQSASPALAFAAARGLSRRESQVCELLLAGRTRGEIERLLGLSEGTVRTHVNNVYHKLGVHSKDEARAAFDAWLAAG